MKYIRAIANNEHTLRRYVTLNSPNWIDFKYRVKLNPWLFYIANRINYRDDYYMRAVKPSSDLVLDGFSRSANSFCMEAFSMSQPLPVNVAHHCHTPSQFILAARWNIPALLLIREPVGAVVSNMIFYGTEDAHRILRRYVQFYTPLLKLRSSFVVADFREVTSDFGRTIRALNERFSTNFVPFEHTSVNVERVENGLSLNGERLLDTQPHRIGNYLNRGVSKDRFRNLVLKPSNEKILMKAKEVYHHMLESAGAIPDCGASRD